MMRLIGSPRPLIVPKTIPHESELEFNLNNSADILHWDKYIALKQYIPRFVINYLYKFFNDNRSLFSENNTEVVNKCFEHDGIVCDKLFFLFNVLTPRIEALTKSKLIPTYTRGRVYVAGSKMNEHVDRAACDVSITFPIAFNSNPWPIKVHPPNSTTSREIPLNVGDVLVYRGGELPHWRDTNTFNDIQYQIFFHWIDTSSEAGSLMSEFSQEEMQDPELWPKSFNDLKRENKIPLPRNKK